MNPSESKHDVRSIRFQVETVREARRIAEGVKKTYGGRSQHYRDAREFKQTQERKLVEMNLQVFGTEG